MRAQNRKQNNITKGQNRRQSRRVKDCCQCSIGRNND